METVAMCSVVQSRAMKNLTASVILTGGSRIPNTTQILRATMNNGRRDETHGWTIVSIKLWVTRRIEQARNGVDGELKSMTLLVRLHINSFPETIRDDATSYN